MTFPVPGHKVTTDYKKRGKYWSTDQAGDPLRAIRRGNNGRPGWGLHTGSDIAAPAGTPIVSATPGEVIAANAYDSSYGYKVIVRWNGLDVWYCHMPKGAARVRVGQEVKAGDRLGAVGATGNVSGEHLHLELRVAGGGFALANFRDPMKAINYAPSAPDNDWFKIALVNHAAASAAVAKVGGKAKWLRRRIRLVKNTKAVNADVIVGLECGSGAQWHYISTKYKKFGYALVPGGSEGRHLWRDPEAIAAPVESGVIHTPAKLRHANNNMPAPYMVAKIDGSLGMVVGLHLDFRATDQQRVDLASHIVAEARKIGAKHGVGPSRIVFAADTASDNWVRDKAFGGAGYADAFDVARKAVNKSVKSNNNWKAARSGPRVDGIFVYRGKGKGKGDEFARPVRVVSQRLDHIATDHHIQAAVIERQS